jgi:dual specificity tyrosine-phosphorylation-regulated kinase 2/3/4
VSATSDISIHPEGSFEKVGELAVPPVPPLPKGYVSMRQGLAQAQYIPLQDPSPINDFAPPLSSPPTSTQSTTSDGSTKPKINKKWSFSSALNLKLHRESSSPSASASDFLEPGPSTPWSEIQRAELGSPRSESSGMTRHDSQSITPVPSALAIPKAQPSSKRLTPSGIPFFRRASSSSIQSKASSITPPQASIPETPRTAAPSKIPSSGQSRKSVLMHLPSMLRGSNSKRGLSQQLAPAPEPDMRPNPEPVSASLGWKGRARGKVSLAPLSPADSRPCPSPEVSLARFLPRQRSWTTSSSQSPPSKAGSTAHRSRQTTPSPP